MKFQITKRSAVSTNYELHVRAIAAEAAQTSEWHSTSHMAQYIKNELERIPRKSTAYASGSYNVEATDKAVEVWHLNSQSERDRLTVKLEVITNH